MLAGARIGANVPVSNLDEAVAFYEGKLGLTLFERGEEQPYARFSGARETKLGVYVSATAGQSRHTLASFVVDDVRAVLTTALESAEDGTRVVTRARRDAGARLAWLTASRRLRRKLESRYGRLAGVVATQIPEERRLPLAAV